MSTKVKKTRFEGYKFQHTVGVDLLTKVWGKFINNHLGVINSISKIDSYMMYDPCPIHPTEDGYHWYGLAKFAEGNDEIAILFPWTQDIENSTNPCDRAVGIYSNEKYSEEEILNFVKKVAKALSKK